MCFNPILRRKRRSTWSWLRPFGKRNPIGNMPKSELRKAKMWEQMLADQGIPPKLVIPLEQGFELPLDEQGDRCEQADLKHRSKLSRKDRRDSQFGIKLFFNEKVL